MKKILIVNGLEEFPEIKYKNCLIYKYVIGVGEEYDKNFISLNNPERLNNISREIRDHYVDWVSMHNKYFLENKLIYRGDLSLFFLTDFSNKRIKLFNTYQDICNIKMLYEIISQLKFDIIEMHGLDRDFVKSFYSDKRSLNLNIKIKETKVRKKIGKNLFFQFLKSLNFIFKNFLILIFHKIFGEIGFNSNNINGDFYLSRYPLNFSKGSKLIEDKYKTIPKNNDKFILSIFSDGLIQSCSIKKYIQSFFELQSFNKEFVLIDQNVNFSDILNSLIINVNNFTKFRKILAHKFYFEDLDITNQIKDEIIFSYGRVQNLLLFQKVFERTIKKYSFNKFIYYLHEYSYGRVISYTLLKNKICNSYGMQHGLPSWSWLVYFMSKRETSFDEFDKTYLNKIPIPNKVLAEDSFSKKIYEYSGYKNVLLMNAVPRLELIKQIKISPIKKYILIAPGLRDENVVLNKLVDEIRNNQNTKYICKCHPHSTNDKSRFKKYKNLFFSKLPMIKLFTNCSCIYVSYSSVGFDAYNLNIPLKIIDIPGILNTSNIIDLNNC